MTATFSDEILFSGIVKDLFYGFKDVAKFVLNGMIGMELFPDELNVPSISADWPTHPIELFSANTNGVEAVKV